MTFINTSCSSQHVVAEVVERENRRSTAALEVSFMTHYLKTDLQGKVKNMPSFYTEALLPVFEAVVNSIQAIQERNASEKGKITVTVKRANTQQKKMGFASDEKIIGFEIEDNGIGFNDINMDSFLTSETTYKMEKGCKGVGRFFWLKAFEQVEIESVYEENESFKKRNIMFSLKAGITPQEATPTESHPCTIVKLNGFKEEYRSKQSAYKTTAKIAQRILEHCMSFYIAETAPQIIVQDEENTYNLQSMYNEIKDNVQTEIFEISGQKFNLSHVKLYATYSKMHNLVLCASSRDVQTKSISSALGVSAEFDDADKKFVYAAYISSPYLDEHVDTGRMAFNIPEEQSLIDDATPENEEEPVLPVTMKMIENEVINRSKCHLAPHLEALQKRKEEIVSEYVAKENPTLRFVPHYCPSVYNEIQPNTSKEKIDEILYKYKGKAEFDIKRRGSALLKKQVDCYEEIQEELDKIESQLEGIQKDQLASYIIFRKMIIDLLEKKLELNHDGKYQKEEIIHDIIFPRKTTTDVIAFENHNLWLIDERLVFHSFAVSDKPLSTYTDSDSLDRPDIVVFSEVGIDKVAMSVSIIELKKPLKEDYDEDISSQLLRYVRQIRAREILAANGRPINVIDTTKFYCYAVCDISDQIDIYAENHSFSKLKDNLGYYTYIPKLNAHLEIIAYDKIVADAKMRHRIFFEKLRIE